LIPPWKIDGKITTFSLTETKQWLNKMEESKYLNYKTKGFLKRKLDKPTLSLRDLLDVEEEIKRYNSIYWDTDDIFKGEIYFHGKTYTLLDTLKTYKKKILYYDFKFEGKLLPVDYCIEYTTKSRYLVNSVYNDIQNIIGEEGLKMINQMSKSNIIDYKNIDIGIYKIIADEARIQIPKNELQERIDKGYLCPFFFVDLSDLINLYWKSICCLIYPVKLLRCFKTVCSQNLNLEPKELIKLIFSDEKYTIFYFVTEKFFNEIAPSNNWTIKTLKGQPITRIEDFSKKSGKIKLQHLNSQGIEKEIFFTNKNKYIMYSDTSKTISFFTPEFLKSKQKFALFSTNKEMEEKYFSLNNK
jgi:hypothetical protein